MREVKRIFQVVQGLVAYGLAPLLEVWPRSSNDGPARLDARDDAPGSLAWHPDSASRPFISSWERTAEGYEATTTHGRARLFRHGKSWYLSLLGEEVDLGRRAEFGHAEAEVARLVAKAPPPPRAGISAYPAGRRTRSVVYNPLAPRPLLPRIWNLSDDELRRLWPGIDPADVRRYAPWATTRSEVERIAYPGGRPAGTELEEYVARAVAKERALSPRPPLREIEVPESTRPPGAFQLRPRQWAPVVLGPDGLPIAAPPLARVVSEETIRRQIGWLEMAVGRTVTVEHIGPILAPFGGETDRWTRRELERVLAIDLREEIPGLQTLINVWRDRNVGLIETGLGAGRADPALRPGLLGDVSRVVEEAHREGLRVEVLANDLAERFGVSDSRAELIARDQVLKLHGQINRQRQMAVGIRSYTWSTSRDERVRESHAELEGTTQSWATPPEVAPGRFEHPGQDFQCRCISIPIMPGDEGEE